MGKKRKLNGEKRPNTTADMNIDSILAQLSSLADNSRSFIHGEPEEDAIWKADIKACEEAADILTALQNEGINDPEQVHDLIADYNALAKQYQTLHEKFEVKARPEQLRDKYICPYCKRMVRGYHDCYCWFCGKRLDESMTNLRKR